MDLWQDFLTNDGKLIHKWVHYFGIYERHFSWFRGKSVTFLEIGVSKGGSLQMWQRYFGPLARIVGIDIDPSCRAHEQPGISVRVGDQGDPAFLQEIIEEFGVPDIVLDDGSHQMRHVNATFDLLYPKLPKNGIYMVEDLHTAYWPGFGGGLKREGTFIETVKDLIDELNADHSRGALAPTAFTRSTHSMHIYDSMVVFERGRHTAKGAPQIGTPDPNYGKSPG